MSLRTHETLGDYFDLQRGTTYKSKLKGFAGPVLLGLASIERNGGFRQDKLTTYGGDSPEKLLVRPGELFVSLKDVTQAGDLLGAVARVPPTVPVGRLTQDTVKLVPTRTNPPLAYLYWLLRTPEVRGLCRSRATGTTNLGLAREDFLSIPVPVLSDERARIVALLEAIEERLTLHADTNRTLEAMAQAIFKSWFIDFDGHDDLVDSEIGPVPRGWEVGTLGDLANLNPESWNKRTRPDSISYVDLSNTKWGAIEAVTEFQAGDAPSRAQRVLRPRDTIVGTVRPGNGSYAFVARSGLTASTGFAVLRPKGPEAASMIYLAATRRENIDRLAHLADGGAYPAVRPEIVAATPTVIPSAAALADFAASVDPLLERIATNRAESRTLADLRDALLPKLISGELRVPEAEELAEVPVFSRKDAKTQRPFA
jgi:type I restriction enzyme S subunit